MGFILSSADTGRIVVLSIALAVIAFILSGYLMSWFLTYGLYLGWFVKTRENRYSRELPSCQEKSQVEMFNEGLAYREEEKAHLEEVSITNDGLHLAAVYLNYGYAKSVIILPGRSETSSYSYFYAELYRGKPYNLLLVDSRATGHSEGKYLTAGIRESGDLLAWARYLHEEKKQSEIVIHGICVGAATALLALAEKDVPSYIKGAVVEGPYKNFQKMFTCHVKAGHHPSYLVSEELPFFFRHWAQVKILRDSPENKIKDVQLPLCFIQGKNDRFVPYADGEDLYAMCGSKKKEFHLLEQGDHSKLRYADRKTYDPIVLTFFDGITSSGLQ